MTLVNINSRPEAAKILFELLGERTKDQSISHKSMPTWEQHVAFLRSKPYLCHWLIEDSPGFVGSIYVTKNYEIGVSIFKRYQRRGYARSAIFDVMARFPGRTLLANVSPRNAASIKLWESLGFRHLQSTFALDRKAMAEAAE